MNDYSEVTCHLQRDVVNLINALNDKDWYQAWFISRRMQEDLKGLNFWTSTQLYPDGEPYSEPK